MDILVLGVGSIHDVTSQPVPEMYALLSLIATGFFVPMHFKMSAAEQELCF
jgi:hypothetical protein